MKVQKIKQAYECPECGEWHEETPEEVAAWKATLEADEITTVAPEQIEAWRVAEVNDNGITTEEPDKVEAWRVEGVGEEDDLAVDEPEEITAYRLECNEVVEEQPEMDEAYRCGECETVYADRDEAKECCRD